MTFSFDADLADDVSRVRQLINDTVDTGHKFEDEALTYYILLGGSVVEAAALSLEQLANRYAMVPDVQVGNKRMAGSQLSVMLSQRAASIRGLGTLASGNATPYVAGLSRAELRDAWDDDDIPRPPFGVVGAQHHPLPKDLD